MPLRIKVGSIKSVVMKEFIGICMVTFFLFSHQEIRAQDKEIELAYFHINDLSVKSYSDWLSSSDESLNSSIKYTCIPAKIIGIKKEDFNLFEIKLKSRYTSVKQVVLTRKEAERKCASIRTH